MATHATRMSSGVAPLRPAGTAVALMAVVTLEGAAPALAAPGNDTTVVETLFGVGPNAPSAMATCPAGSRVVGGGAGPASNGTTESAVQLSGPVDDSASSDATIAEASFSFPDGAQREGGAIVRCPAGQRALGGGIITTATTASSTVRRSAPQVGAGFATIQSALANGATVDTDVSRRWAGFVVNADLARDYNVLALCAADEALTPPNNIPGGGAGGGGGTDTVAPAFAGSVNASPATFAVNFASAPEQSVKSAAKRKPKKGTTFRYSLTEAARVVCTIERKGYGRRVGRTCRRQTGSNRTKRRCTRYTLVDAFAQQAAAGKNNKAFSGRIGRKTLSPGKYRVSLVATDTAGNESAVKRIAFKVVRDLGVMSIGHRLLGGS
jgi:hypothetical protein